MTPTVRTPSPLSTSVPFVLGVFTLVIGAEPELGIYALPFCVLGVVAVFMAWPRRVEIGAEGIRIRAFFRRRTIAYRSIRLAAPVGKRKLSLTTVGGERLTLHAPLLGGAFPSELLDRFWRAIAAGAEDGSRGVERDTLGRSGRTTPQWRAALCDLAKPSTYRQVTVSHDRLWTIAENPGIAPEVRAGAIVALSASSLDAGGRDRLRRIDATTVDPSLHALLEHAANVGEPDARIIEAALDGLAH